MWPRLIAGVSAVMIIVVVIVIVSGVIVFAVIIVATRVRAREVEGCSAATLVPLRPRNHRVLIATPGACHSFVFLSRTRTGPTTMYIWRCIRI